MSDATELVCARCPSLSAVVRALTFFDAGRVLTRCRRLACSYEADETPMTFYFNAHQTLEKSRQYAKQSGGCGPRTIVGLLNLELRLKGPGLARL